MTRLLKRGAPGFVLVLLAASSPIRAQQDTQPSDGAIRDAIQRAGNADDDRTRLACLKELRGRPDLEPSAQGDLDVLIAHVDRWVNEKRLFYFASEIKDLREIDFKIPAASPFFPLTDLYRGRMYVWDALERHWSAPERRRVCLERARESLERYATAFPENRIARMYLGQPVPAEKPYAAAPGAPAWAVQQREGLERLTDIIEWWIDNHQLENGAFGGGWGDDCEMWLWWAPVLIGFDDPRIAAAQERFSKAVFAQPHMKSGYTAKLTDVEHSAEDSAYSITPMMHVDPDNEIWTRRALRLAELMEQRWTGRNERGFLQFKSAFFTADKIDRDSARACDTLLHARVVQPALLYWQRTGDERLTRLFTSWLDMWVDAAARDERGKPAGVLPSAVHWPDGGIGSLAPEWWNPGITEDTLYRWPNYVGDMLDTLLLAHHITGEARFLEPLRTMAEVRRKYLEHDPVQAAAPGMHRAGQLSVALSAAKCQRLTGTTEFDALLAQEHLADWRFPLPDDLAPWVPQLRANAEALRINFPGFTSEVRYTDRVLRFPVLFGPDGMLSTAASSAPGPPAEPDPKILYMTGNGGIGSPAFFPIHALRWLTPPREIATAVTDAGPDGLRALLFHFGENERAMGAEFYLLRPGSYTLTLSAGDDEHQPPLAAHGFEMNGRRSRVSFELPAQRLCVLNARRRSMD